MLHAEPCGGAAADRRVVPVTRRIVVTPAVAGELVGTAVLTTAVVGSGIMAERLAGGNAAVALLANTIATGAALAVLIAVLGPVSGAHLNPVVSVASAWWSTIDAGQAAARAMVQVLGAALGVGVAHAMYGLPLVQAGTTVRSAPGLWISEFVATCGLVTVVRLCPRALAAPVVSLYIVSAYWFTASTSFANPAVTLARTVTRTFAGIRAEDAPGFVFGQLVGAAAATMLLRWLVPPENARS